MISLGVLGLFGDIIAIPGLRLVGVFGAEYREDEWYELPPVLPALERLYIPPGLPIIPEGLVASPYEPTLRLRSLPQLILRTRHLSPRSPAGLSTV